MSEALRASWLASRAWPSFCLTVAVSSSMAEAVSSSEAAWSSVRADRSLLPAAIWALMLATPARHRAHR
jgi:hypothetical protein